MIYIGPVIYGSKRSKTATCLCRGCQQTRKSEGSSPPQFSARSHDSVGFVHEKHNSVTPKLLYAKDISLLCTGTATIVFAKTIINLRHWVHVLLRGRDRHHDLLVRLLDNAFDPTKQDTNMIMSISEKN